MMTRFSSRSVVSDETWWFDSSAVVDCGTWVVLFERACLAMV